MKITAWARLGLLAGAAVLLGACSQSPSTTTADNAAPTTQPAAAKPPAKKPVKTPFDSLMKDEQKAKDVGNVLQKADKKRQQAIKDAGG